MVNFVYADEHELHTPSDVKPGTYRLVMGFYLADTLERIPLAGNPAVENNAIEVGTIAIQ